MVLVLKVGLRVRVSYRARARVRVRVKVRVRVRITLRGRVNEHFLLTVLESCGRPFLSIFSGDLIIFPWEQNRVQSKKVG